MKTNIERIQFVKSVFGSTKVARDGVNIAVKCPSCNEKKGKFSINVSNWMCHCWVCGVKSKNLYFILKKHVGSNSALRFIENFGPPKGAKKEDHEEVIRVEVPDGFIPLATFSGRDPDIRDVVSYCKKRGISERDFWYFRLGASSSPEMRRRIIIPSFDSEGNINFFVSRTIDKKGFPKYLNSKAKKTNIIFNEINIDWSKELVIVEGPFDLMKSTANSTCLLGSKLPKSSLLFSKIVENKTPVLLALDDDMKGEMQKIARLLTSYNVQVRVFKNRSSGDVGEMDKKDFKEMCKLSKVWTEESILKFKINSIKSGSIF